MLALAKVKRAHSVMLRHHNAGAGWHLSGPKSLVQIEQKHCSIRVRTKTERCLRGS